MKTAFLILPVNGVLSGIQVEYLVDDQGQLVLDENSKFGVWYVKYVYGGKDEAEADQALVFTYYMQLKTDVELDDLVTCLNELDVKSHEAIDGLEDDDIRIHKELAEIRDRQMLRDIIKLHEFGRFNFDGSARQPASPPGHPLREFIFKESE